MWWWNITTQYSACHKPTMMDCVHHEHWPYRHVTIAFRWQLSWVQSSNGLAPHPFPMLQLFCSPSSAKGCFSQCLRSSSKASLVSSMAASILFDRIGQHQEETKYVHLVVPCCTVPLCIPSLVGSNLTWNPMPKPFNVQPVPGVNLYVPPLHTDMAPCWVSHANCASPSVAV